MIAGGGPAGVAVAVDAVAEGRPGPVTEGAVVGRQAGGSSRIENDVGFPTSIFGAGLTSRGETQAMRLDTRFVVPRRVNAVEGSGEAADRGGRIGD